MNILKIPYGNDYKDVKLKQEVVELSPKDTKNNKEVFEIIKNSVLNPFGSNRLSKLVKSNDDVVIVINDITRPTPTKIMLDIIIDELKYVDISNDKIKILIANGAHRPCSIKEIDQMIGKDIRSKFEIINHQFNNDSSLKFIGKTAKGMPIYINKVLAEASIKILTGIISPHHIAGFSGGRKSIIPGCSGLITLKTHHSFPIAPYNPSIGIIKNNEFHNEAMEGARLVGVDFILNVVQNKEHEVIASVAGDLEKAYLEGVEIAKKQWEVNVENKFDLAIISPGKYPKDINLHQSQKAISAAEMIVKKNHPIILVANCPNKIGSFYNWMTNFNTPEEVIQGFKKEGFTMENSLKAFMLARGCLSHNIYVVSDNLTDNMLNDIFLKKANSVEEALEIIEKQYGNDLKIAYLPNASEIIPKL